MASVTTSHGSVDDDFSVELGRGGKKVSIAPRSPRNLDDTLNSSDAMVGRYRVMYTPPQSKTAAIPKNTRFGGRYASSRDSQNNTEAHTGLNTVDHQSYILPDLPNLSELVSGTYQDGTPVFSRTNTLRSGRFTSAKQTLSRTVGHKRLDALPVPDDEKQIFAMLKLLQEKVGTLEKEKAAAEQKNEELVEENAVLMKEKRDARRFRRSDSALGTSDDEAMGRAQSKLAAEKTRLEANIGTLRAKLEAADRKLAITDITIANVSKERDSALAQLSNAFFSAEELKAENRKLRKEIESLRLQLSKLNQRPSSTPKPAKERKKKQIVVEVDATESADARIIQNEAPPMQTRNETSTVRDRTYLSFIDPASYVADLRKGIEEDRARNARRNENPLLQHDPTRTDRAASAPPIEPTFTRKSSLKNVTNTKNVEEQHTMTGAQNTRDEAAEDGDPSTNLDIADRRALDPNLTARSNTSRRRIPMGNDFADDNMTSGFILPDITISNHKHAHLSDAAQAVLNTVAPHGTDNCIVCKRISGPEKTSHVHKTVKIPALVPPSLRTPAPTADNPDPTVRPAQPPKIALAVVVKELNDELAHLKSDLASYQALYNRTDPSLSRRRRVMVYEKIQLLLKSVEIKSDQIYRLNDVAEDQKDMTKEEIEVTIGLNDIVREHVVGGHADDDEDRENGHMQPWEGIESTEDLTRQLNNL